MQYVLSGRYEIELAARRVAAQGVARADVRSEELAGARLRRGCGACTDSTS